MNEHKNIITIEDEIKEFSDKPVKSSALFKKIKELEESGGGGMPKDYPYTGQILFDGDVVYADEDGNLGYFESSAEQLLITIDGVTHTLTWSEEGFDWRNSDVTVEVGIGEKYCWLWVDDMPDGTYAVTLREAGIDSNFENAVEEIAGGSSGELPLYFIDWDNPPSREEIVAAVFAPGTSDLVKMPIILLPYDNPVSLPILQVTSDPNNTWTFDYEYMSFQGQYSTITHFHVEWTPNGVTMYRGGESIEFEQI